MRHFDIDSNGIYYKGERSLIAGGDLHYFRIDKSAWKERMLQAREMGCNLISVYIPWLVHEIAEGDYDFDGRTHERRDLKGFLAIAGELDMPVIAKPGPYVYSELPGQGLPNWFIERHPEAWAKYFDGETFRPHAEGDTAPMSYLHPVFMEASAGWMRKISEILRPFLRSSGGSVEYVQVCNEISGIHVWNKGYDQNPETIGLGKEDGMYATFLSEKYGGNIETISKVHGKDYKRFSDVGVPEMGGACKNEALFAEYSDFYYNHYIPKYVHFVAKEYKKNGIDVPLVTNIAFPEMVVQMREAMEKNTDVFCGIDLYYTFLHNKELGPKNISYACELGPEVLAKVCKMPPVSLEFQAGAPDELTYPITRSHAYIWALWAFVSGYEGINLYVLAGGSNIPKVGNEGTTYHYQAPIAPDGTLRKTYYGFRDAFSEAKSLQWLAGSTKICDMAVGIVDMQPYRDNASRVVCEALFRLNYSFEAVVLDEISIDALCEKPALWVACEKRMPRDTQKKLAMYVELGGKLIVTGDMPQMDVDFSDCSDLTDALGVSLEESGVETNLFMGMEMGTSACKTVNCEKVVEPLSELADGRVTSAVCGHGKGLAAVVPFELELTKYRELDFYENMLEKLQIEQYCQSEGLRTIVRKAADGSAYLCALNFSPDDVSETVTVGGKPYELTLSSHSVVTKKIQAGGQK